MNRRDWLRAAIGGGFATVAGGQDSPPQHPRDLTFPTLHFEPPDPSRHRHELASGSVAYLVEDHQLPLINLSVTMRAGSYRLTPEEAGLASLTGSQMRGGGTTTRSAADFDEEAAFLATELGTSLGATSGQATVDCLARNLETSLNLFFDMLKNPGFDPERLEVARARTLQGLARRNDRLEDIMGREFGRLIRGTHFSTVAPTQASIESVSPEGMRRVHRSSFDPTRMYFAVSGDFDADDMVRHLNAALAAGWPTAGKQPPAIPAPTHEPRPGVYVVDKSSREVNQSHVRLGHIGIQRNHPDVFKVRIMNSVLGGGGFTSRIMTRVRSDEGLAYSAYSRYQPGTYYPGTFSTGFQSRNATCAQAAELVVEEIRRMQDEKVTARELDTAKNYLVEIFPRFFATARQVAGTFAQDEFTGRDKDYWKLYRERISDVSANDVLDAAQKHLHPDALVVLVVGARDAVLAGNPDRPGFSFESLAGEAGIESIPLPDPLTMQYPEA